MDQYKIANNIHRLRKQQHMSVEALAEAIGKSARQVSRYLSGECKTIGYDTLNKISEVLGVDIINLLT